MKYGNGSLGYLRLGLFTSVMLHAVAPFWADDKIYKCSYDKADYLPVQYR
jgi:hypothetical protein